MTPPQSRDGPPRLVVAGSACALAVVLMAWDHLVGNQGGSTDDFPVDAPTFALAIALVAAVAAIVFGVTVPRAAKNEGRAPRSALLHSILAAILFVPASWLGFPLVIAAGGIALALPGLNGPSRRAALWALVIAVLVTVMSVLATAFPTADTD